MANRPVKRVPVEWERSLRSHKSNKASKSSSSWSIVGERAGEYLVHAVKRDQTLAA